MILGRYLKILPANYSLLIIINVFFVGKGEASPWLEASDPFLRSSVILLSDAGLLSAPGNHYPARWSFFGDELMANSSSRFGGYSIDMAKLEVGYSLQSAKLNRGNRSLKVVGANRPPTFNGFGQFLEDERGVYTSYEHLDQYYAFRLSGSYREYSGEKEISWDGSYLSFNDGSWLYSVGNISRWWGQGWQHNLILGSYAKAEPDISASYTGENDFLGFWSLETLLAIPDHAFYDYHSATRLVSKPFKFFEYGVTYQAWLLNANEGDRQVALDARLTLPPIKELYHSIYGEVASTSKLAELGAWLIGWTGSFPVANNTARIVLESQQSTDAHNSTSWQSGTYPSINKKVANTTYQLDNSISIALYVQLNNDHNIGFSYQESELNDQNTDSTQLTYRLPVLSGMFHLGLGYNQIETRLDYHYQTEGWVGYEFRF